MEERKIITNGYSWLRFVLIVIAFFIVISIENYFTKIIILLVSVLLFYWLKRARKLQYDANHLYIIHDIDEQIIPFTSIISIKRSRAKVNGERFWILLYKNENGDEKKCRFFNFFLYTQFLDAVKTKNPKVVI